MRKSTILVLLAFVLGATSAWAQGEIKLTDGAPDRYIVVKGDTLWGIAVTFLKDPWRWPEVWRMNKDQIKDPHWIHPGNVIVLDRSKTPPQLILAQTLAQTLGQTLAQTLAQTVKLSPQVRPEAMSEDAIPAIPPKAIEPFLTHPLIIEEGGLEKAPRIIATEENRVHLGPGAVAYISGLGNSKETTWQIFRPGRALVDPETQQRLGHEAVYLGTGLVTRSGEPATMQIITTAQEISTGDRLIAAGTPVIVQYAPRAPSVFLRGRIIGLYDRLPTSEGGKFSIISINKGRRDGVEQGHVLGVLRSGASVPDPQSNLSRDRAPRFKLPDERYGLLFVFRTFEAVSYALVMESTRPISAGDIVQTP